ncbi:MAG TPA: metal ABC transporter permease [Ktedonobacteraceae bacterium]|jgi:zinc/manganese transport system permease protein|nr:metal ABC transporter permease [Ktedonobacteraceae bacterium]
MFDLFFSPFIQNALLTGTCVAIVSAFVGYFLIARRLTFAGHALSHIGFAGAAGAVLLGLSPLFGLLVFTMGSGIGISLLSKESRERDLAIGIMLTFALGLGMLFLSLYAGFAERVYAILFGDILGISQADVLVTAAFSLLTIVVVLALFRPLLFSSFDAEVAEARGVPVRALGIGFLLLLAIAVSMSVQVIGVLLVFTLLVGPAATAMRLVKRPLWVILLAMVLGVIYVWGGIFLAINVAGATWPPSFFISTLSFCVYLPVRLLSPLWNERRKQSQVGVGQQLAVQGEMIEQEEQGMSEDERVEDRVRGLRR